jgi:ATP-binding cassette subfamily F protein 3
VQRGERWAILGANGSGKTTLLRTLIGTRSPIRGELEWNESLDIGYYDQQLQDLDPEATVLEEIRSLDATASDGALRSYLARFLFANEDVFKNVRCLSGGEKSRLMLAKIIYLQPQLLALDEPTNHLDISSREALEDALVEYPGTILFVSHDRYLVQKIASHLLYLENGVAYSFDRLTAFEEWLAADVASTSGVRYEHTQEGPRTGAGLSKNRREQLIREASEIENKIAAIETQLAELEISFQNPSLGTDWERTHKRYADLKLTLENLYADLGSRWELLG